MFFSTNEGVFIREGRSAFGKLSSIDTSWSPHKKVALVLAVAQKKITVQ